MHVFTSLGHRRECDLLNITHFFLISMKLSLFTKKRKGFILIDELGKK